MDEEKLVDLVSKYEFLYDKTHPKHSNKHYVAKAWDAISLEVNCSAHVVKRKWANLRDYFRRQLREEQDKTIPQKKKKWLLFDKFSFLLPYIRLKEEKETETQVAEYENFESMSPSSFDSIGETVDDDIRYEERWQDSNGTTVSKPPVPLYLTEAAPNAMPKSESKTVTTTTTTTTAASDFQNKDSHILSRTKPTATDHGVHLSASNSPTSTAISSRSKPVQSNFTPSSTHRGVKRRFGDDGSGYMSGQDTSIDDDDQFFKSCAPMVKMLSPIQKLEFRISVQQLLLKFIKENSQSEVDTSSSNLQ